VVAVACAVRHDYVQRSGCTVGFSSSSLHRVDELVSGRGRGHVVETALCPSGKRLSRPTDSRQTDGRTGFSMKPRRRQQWHSSIIIAIIVIIIIQVPLTLPHSTAQLSTLLPSHGQQKCAFQPAASSFPTSPLHVSHVPHYVVLTRRNLPTSRQDMRARLLARPLRNPLARHRTSPRINPPLPIATPCKLPPSSPPSRLEGSRLLYSVHAGLRRVVCAVVRAWRLGSWGRYPRRQDRV
jgi:hypothetical protein